MNTAVYIVSAIVLLTTCTSPSKLISWKDSNSNHKEINKVLIIGIVHDSLLDVRKEVEAYFSNALKSKGYTTSISTATADYKGLSRLAQELTYIQLCNEGIDAVLTVALLNEKKVNKYHDIHAKRFTSAYYYNRLINYRSLRATPKDVSQNGYPNNALLWEVTLFNLSTLSPVYWAQTKSFPSAIVSQQHATYSKIIMRHLSKQKILK
ncbi:MAG TPA: hypothetical protein VD794_08355 [Flavisolibacter sp.]|nr:hypothetical protein [Flavisolibacter sp.]